MEEGKGHMFDMSRSHDWEVRYKKKGKDGVLTKPGMSTTPSPLRRRKSQNTQIGAGGRSSSNPGDLPEYEWGRGKD